MRAPRVREVLDQVKHEGDPSLQLAPLKSVPKGLPPAWQRLLKRSDAAEAVFDLLWKPVAVLLPRTIRAFRASTTALGLLQTKTRPPSLVYFYAADGETYAYRGFVPGRPAHPAASRLPKEFLEFSRVHDGWVFIPGYSMGPLPSRDWSPLSDDPKSPGASFLTVFSNGGGGSVGFDLSLRVPRCHTIWNDDPPDAHADVWEGLDEWITGQQEDADQVKGRPLPPPRAWATDRSRIPFGVNTPLLRRRRDRAREFLDGSGPDRARALKTKHSGLLRTLADEAFVVAILDFFFGAPPERVRRGFRAGNKDLLDSYRLGWTTEPVTVISDVAAAMVAGDLKTADHLSSRPERHWGGPLEEEMNLEVLAARSFFSVRSGPEARARQLVDRLERQSAGKSAGLVTFARIGRAILDRGARALDAALAERQELRTNWLRTLELPLIEEFIDWIGLGFCAMAISRSLRPKIRSPYLPLALIGR